MALVCVCAPPLLSLKLRNKRSQTKSNPVAAITGSNPHTLSSQIRSILTTGDKRFRMPFLRRPARPNLMKVIALLISRVLVKWSF